VKVLFRRSFQKDLTKSCDSVIARQVHKLIMRLENAKSLVEIPNIKRLAGNPTF